MYPANDDAADQGGSSGPPILPDMSGPTTIATRISETEAGCSNATSRTLSSVGERVKGARRSNATSRTLFCFILRNDEGMHQAKATEPDLRR